MENRKQAASWGGQPPQSPEEARTRLAEIAIDCFASKGMRKAFMAEVARMAGISRPTLYSYYPTKESLMFGALGIEVEAWYGQVRKRVRRFDTPQERLVEGVLYAISELPRTRVLKFIADPAYVEFVAKDDPGMLRTLGANVEALQDFFELAPELREREMEIAELVQRTITSFLQYEMGTSRTTPQLRALLHRTLVPAVGLPQLTG